jgi:hypothetical protein
MLFGASRASNLRRSLNAARQNESSLSARVQETSLEQASSAARVQDCSSLDDKAVPRGLPCVLGPVSSRDPYNAQLANAAATSQQMTQPHIPEELDEVLYECCEGDPAGLVQACLMSVPTDLGDILCDPTPSVSRTTPSPSTIPDTNVGKTPLLPAKGLDGNLYSLLRYELKSTEFEDFHVTALQNVGNTCFLNALLHSLARVSKVRQWTTEHQALCPFAGDTPGKCCLCDLAFDLTAIAVDVQKDLMIPRTVTFRHVWGGDHFKDPEQHDVPDTKQHDVFEAFNELLPGACDGVDLHAARDLQLPALDLELNLESQRYSTPFYKAFGGVEKSSVDCSQCGHHSVRRDPFPCLSLAVPAESATIEQLLAAHWGAHPLDAVGDHCHQPTCQRYKCQTRDLQLECWPRVLCLHLKRWVVRSYVPFRLEKIDSYVGFEALLSVPGKSRPFVLQAVIVHDGVAGAGHYTAFVHAADNQWYFCNDRCSPERVSPADVIVAQAYMLFYED